MKRVIIVVEGQTEQEFVKQCISPYLLDKYGVFSVSARLIGVPGHKGGDVRYGRLKKDVAILLREPDVIVSTFVDYFRLGNDFPNAAACLKINGIDAVINCLEQAIAEQVDSELFVPYIQKHEFESLLFSSNAGFSKYFKPQSCQELEAIRSQFPNPEDINGNQSPSYRLIDTVQRCEKRKYKKVTDGNIIALEVGIGSMLARCERFAAWINLLGRMASQNS